MKCEKAFNQKGALQIHLMKHSGDKPYHCDFCPSAFSQRGNLRAHIQVHPRVTMSTQNIPLELFMPSRPTELSIPLGSVC